MTHDDFISIVRKPETVKAEYEADLKELVDRYPYFVPARMLLVSALKQAHSIHSAANVKIASVYCSDRRWLYYYLYPEKALSTEPYLRNKVGKSSGDYFDMINTIELEGGDTKQSLKGLAERLKSARAMVATPTEQPVKKTVLAKGKETVVIEIKNSEATDNEFEKVLIPKVETKMVEFKEIETPSIVIENSIQKTNSEDLDLAIDKDISESNARKLIKEHKYKEAIEILTALNLNNPKKSVYFADQIRFLEKVIANSKK